MTRPLIQIACLTGLLLIAGFANGAEPSPPPERYEVELILFRHLDQSRNTPEIPAASSIFNPSPLNLTLAEIPMRSPTENPLIIDTGARQRRPAIGFFLLELDSTYPDFVPLHERALVQTYERLERIEAYDPLLHTGWIQPARNSENSRPYRFEPDTADHSGISGTVTLYKERYLHLDVDLTLESAKPPGSRPLFFGAGTDDSPDVYKLTESRRIRGTATHYFDSPQFGLIARIREVRAAAAEREETG